jgi:hypothetical protein
MQYDKFIYFDENYCVQVDNRDECIDEIIKEYHKYDSSMYDILATTQLEGFSIEDNVYIYATCMNIADGDTIIHFRDEKWCVLSDDFEKLGRNK